MIKWIAAVVFTPLWVLYYVVEVVCGLASNFCDDVMDGIEMSLDLIDKLPTPRR